MLGISTKRYGDIEAGSDLSIEIAQLIVSKVPGCSLDWLYNGVEDGLSISLHRRLMAERKLADLAEPRFVARREPFQFS